MRRLAILAAVVVGGLTAVPGSGILTADAQDPVQPVTWEQVAPRLKEYTIIQHRSGAITANQRIVIDNYIDYAVLSEQRGLPFPWGP